VEISLQEGTYLPLYARKMRNNLEDRLIPEINNTIANKSWALVAEKPVGGLMMATRFLEGLHARCKNTLEQLQATQQEVKARADQVAKKYAVARDQGNAALQNRPSWARTLGRMGLLWAILITNLALVIAITPQAAWRYFLDLLRIPQGLYTLLLMSVACALKYSIVDDAIGFSRIRRGEDNTPSPIVLAVSVVYVLGVGGLLGWNFYRWSVDPTMPTPVLRYQGMIFFGIFVIGLWAIINYVFWYWLDTRKMWYLASQWMEAHDELAKHNALWERIAVGQEFYKAVADVVGDQLQKIRAFKEKLEQLQQDFKEEAQQSLAALNHTALPFKKFVVTGSKAESIYREHILDIRNESTQFFHAPRAPFISWRETDKKEIKNSIAQYIEERFSEYWQKHGVTQLSTPVEHPSSTDLQKSLGWIADEVSKPYWPYYGGTQGIIRVHIGVGSQEEEQEGNLLSALKSLAGSFGAAPLFFDTGDKHAVSCITFRYNVPLHLLAWIDEFKQQYEIHAKKDEALHVSAEMVSLMSSYDLLPKEGRR